MTAEQQEKKGRRSWLGRVFKVLGVLLLIALIGYVWPDEQIEVGLETTYVTGPLDDEGYVDYLAVINAKAKRGVTPENNGAVLYWQAMGPEYGPLAPDWQKIFYGEIGMEVPPEEGDYLEPFNDFVSGDWVPLEELADQESDEKFDEEGAGLDAERSSDDLWDRRAELMNTPWSTEDDPAMARWIARNDSSLDKFIEGTRRSHFYVPLIRVDPPAQPTEPHPPVLHAEEYGHKLLEVSRALATRAMFRVGSGQYEAAWQDTLAAMRLTRQSASDKSLVHALVNVAQFQIALQTIPPLLHEGQLSIEQIRSMQREFDEVAHRASISQALDWGERIGQLDMMQAMDRYTQPLSRRVPRGGLDWNFILRSTNERIDRMVTTVAAYEANTPLPEDPLDIEEVHAWAKRVFSFSNCWKYPFSRNRRSEIWRDMLQAMIFPAIITSYSTVLEVDNADRQTRVAFALSLFRAEHGQYPESLDALVPIYLKAVPSDRWDADEKPMRYRREGDGYVVYSVGRDAEDDEGLLDGEAYEDDEGFRLPGKLSPLQTVAEE